MTFNRLALFVGMALEISSCKINQTALPIMGDTSGTGSRAKTSVPPIQPTRSVEKSYTGSPEPVEPKNTNETLAPVEKESTAASDLPAAIGPTFRASSEIESIFNGNHVSGFPTFQSAFFGSSSFSMSNPSSNYFSLKSSELFRQDGTAWSVPTQNAIYFGNYRCYGINGYVLDLSKSNSSLNEILRDSNKHWCQQIYRDSYNHARTENHFWSQGTRVTWGAFPGESNGTSFTTLLNFTENKSTRDAQGNMRRGWKPIDPSFQTRYANKNLADHDASYFGYVNFKMDGSPVNPAHEDESSITDGFYNGFISVGRIDDWDGTKNPSHYSLASELGPIIWPVAGYRTWSSSLGGWRQSSIGVRHPRGFIHGDYFYVYYLDHGGIDGDGKSIATGGVYVARAPKNSLTPGSFKCGADFKVNCLPYNPSDYYFEGKWHHDKFQEVLGLPGPKVEPLIPSSSILSFSVAKIEGSNSFVAVYDEFLENGTKGKVFLSFSTDLITWTVGELVPGTNLSQSGWNYGKLLFPIFAGSLGNPNLVSIRDEFTIVGTSGLDELGQTCSSGWQCQVNGINVRLDP
jgi:hypothetical protein